MKTIVSKSLGLGIIIGLGLLGGCAQQGLDASKSIFQQSAETALVKMANRVSSVRGVATTSGRGVVLPSTLTMPAPYNNYYMQSDLTSEFYSCKASSDAIQNFQAKVTQFYQCVVSITQRQNPVQTFLYRSLDGTNLNGGAQPAWQYSALWSPSTQQPFSFQNYNQLYSQYGAQYQQGQQYPQTGQTQNPYQWVGQYGQYFNNGMPQTIQYQSYQSY